MAQTAASEVKQLRAELEALKSQLQSERAARFARTRSVLAWSLTVLAVLATTMGLMSLWTFRTLTDTDVFVDRVGGVIEQPEVAAAVGELAAEELVTALDLEQRLRDALPDEIAVAAGPITAGAQNYLAQGATRLVETERFQAAWNAALAGGHRITVSILSGADTTSISNDNGVIVLDITPVVNMLLAEGTDFVSDLLDREISAPTVTPENIDQAVAALEEQLGTDLPDDFGQVTLFASEDLAAAQAGYQALKLAVWLVPLAAAVLIALAIAVSPNRVRAGMSIIIGTAFLLLLMALVTQPLKSSVLSSLEEQGLAGAVAAGFDTVFSSLRSGIVVVVLLAALASLVLFLVGDSRYAESGRALLGRTPEFAAQHRAAFLAGGGVAALVLLAVIPGRSWGQVIFVLVVYAAYALAVLLAPRVAGTEEDSGAAPAT